MCDRSTAKWVVAFCACVWAYGCDSEAERLRDDSRRFLALYEAIDYRAHAALREPKVEALAQVPLADETVRQTRDLCVDAHRILLREERAQEEHAAEIESAIAKQTDGGPLDAATIARLQARLKESELGLSRAREQLKTCESQARSLGLRFGKR